MKPYYEDDAVTLHHGDCLDVLRGMPDNSVDSVVTDPPYALSFMGRHWDAHKNPAAFQEWCEAWVTECLRILKPGGHLISFGGTRTFHRLACAVEDAGFEIRDSIAWMYGSGFPKSLDVSKAIDKAAGAEREVVGQTAHPDGRPRGLVARDLGVHEGGQRLNGVGLDITAAATPDAETWQGWGTALKPAFEPIVVARKPFIGTVAANVLAHGTGALNIDGCRVESESPVQVAAGRTQGGWIGPQPAKPYELGTGREYREGGRWPANVILDESQAVALDA